MLCEVCAQIDFKFLRDWKDKHHFFDDHLNVALAAYSASYPTDQNIAAFKIGEAGNVYEHCFHHDSSFDLIDSARAGCHLCAFIAYGLYDEEGSNVGKQCYPLPEADRNCPVILCIIRSRDGRPWWQVREDIFDVYCGDLTCRLCMVDTPNCMSTYFTGRISIL